MSAMFPESPRIWLITDGKGDAPRILRIVQQAYEAGVRDFQFRERNFHDRDYLRLLLELRKRYGPGEARLFVNDRLDLCRIAGLDGVQLGFRSCTVKQARSFLGKDTQLGVSAHSLVEAEQAERDGADHVFYGPIYPTPSKKGILQPVGVNALHKLVRKLSIPVYAIGGMQPSNLQSVLSSGCHGVALIRAIFDARFPRKKARQLVSLASAHLS